MKILPAFFIALLLTIFPRILHAEPPAEPSHIAVEVEPYYNSAGPKIEVGSYSEGLASKDEKAFAATIAKMKQDWQKLSFPQLFVGSIRLYDLGYRKEAVYWFYTAQYRGRLFCSLLDQEKMGGMGDPGFELYQAYAAFFQLVGPYVNGYAFGDVDGLAVIIKRVKEEGETLPDIKATYPGVTFKGESQWKDDNKTINDGLGQLLAILPQKKAEMKETRAKNGTEAAFSKLTSKDLPGQ